ncbi:MAG: DUF5596 domain-containing protein [Clostridia bacterium]|nr:DUF5596 domain-containing protein [Clostridia bacterium]
MSGNTQSVIRRWYDKLGFPESYDGEFFRALEEVTVPPEAALETYDKGCKDGIKNLIYYLYFCESAAKNARNTGIPEEVTPDTLKDIVILAEDWTQAKGKLCLFGLKWLSLHLTQRLFKLGRLQFALSSAMKDIPALGIKAGDSVIEIHIPRGGKLIWEECALSIARAEAFFGEHFPNCRFKAFVCFSWLLDPELKAFLPEDSNILRFAQEFTPVYSEPSDLLLSSVFRVDTKRENLASAVCTTAFAQRIKAAVLGGRRFNCVYGYIPAKGAENRLTSLPEKE